MRRTEGAAALALLDRELIDAESPSPLYFQLYTVLHDAIVRGVLADGATLALPAAAGHHDELAAAGHLEVAGRGGVVEARVDAVPLDDVEQVAREVGLREQAVEASEVALDRLLAGAHAVPP